MSDYIKGFKFFCQKVLPLVYDDSLSYYEVLCKAISKMNEIGSILNEQGEVFEDLDERYRDLENKVEGLIENLVDVIVPWDSSVAYRVFSIVEYQGTNYIAVQDVPIGTMITNTDYWQPSNTIIEQINAISVIVSELQVHSGVNDDIGLIFPTMGEEYDPVGACNIFYTGNGHACLIDLGRYEVFSYIKRALDKVGVNTIDAVFLTHYHGDHTGEAFNTAYDEAYDQWKDNYDMNQTVFYVPPVTNNYTTDCPEKIRQSFENNEIVTMQAGERYTWNDVRFTPYNISASDFAYYDTNSPNDYNAYSAIIYAEYGNSVFLCTGDVNPTAQARCYAMEYTKHADIVTIPHHGVNSAGDVNFINDIAPLYSYVPTGSDVNKTGLKGPELFTASLYGPVFSNRLLNEYGVSFVFGKTGISVTGGQAELISGYGYDSYRTVYVNEQYTGGEENGTVNKPYSNIRRAINSCKGITKIILNSDITISPIFNNNNGKITVEGNSHSIAYCALFNAQIEFKNVTFNSNLISNDSRVILNACTFNDTIQFNRSHATVTNCTFNHDGTKINGAKSFITLDSPTGTNTATGNFTNLGECFLTGSFGIGTLGTGNKIVNHRGYTDFGRLVETATILDGLFPGAGSPPFLYDTTNNRIRITTPDGTKYYIS